MPPWPPSRWHERQASFGEANTAAPRPTSPDLRVLRASSATRAGSYAVHAERVSPAANGLLEAGRGLGAAAVEARACAAWARAGRLAVELGHEPVEAVEVVAQPLLGVVLGVAEDADRPAVAAVADDPQQLEVAGALAQRQDLPAVAVASLVHAVEVDRCTRYGMHLREQAGEAVEVVVAVVQVVDDADVVDALLLQPLDDRELVLGLAEPAAVVVEGQRAADLAGLLGQRAELCRRGRDPPLLLGAGDAIAAQVEQDPELAP